MAIVSERHSTKQEDIGQLTTEQKLLSNKDLLSRNFQEVIQNLDECDQYIDSVIVSNMILLLLHSPPFWECQLFLLSIVDILVSNNIGMLTMWRVGKWGRG